MLNVELKPLNLHERTEPIDQETLNQIPLSQLTLNGRYTISDAHTWISACLPDVPHNVSHETADSSTTLYFKSTFVQTVLILELKNGSLTVLSDNLSAIAIIKVRISYPQITFPRIK